MDKYLIIVFIYFITVAGCKTVQVTDNILTSDNRLYNITISGKEWDLKKITNEVTVLQNKGNHATVAFITNPIETEELPLNVMVNHLLIEIKNKNIFQRNETLIDGIKAINVVLNGEVDGNVVKINSFVTKKGKFAFNIIYWAHPDDYKSSIERFESLVKSFKFIN